MNPCTRVNVLFLFFLFFSPSTYIISIYMYIFIYIRFVHIRVYIVYRYISVDASVYRARWKLRLFDVKRHRNTRYQHRNATPPPRGNAWFLSPRFSRARISRFFPLFLFPSSLSFPFLFPVGPYEANREARRPGHGASSFRAREFRAFFVFTFRPR